MDINKLLETIDRLHDLQRAAMSAGVDRFELTTRSEGTILVSITRKFDGDPEGYANFVFHDGQKAYVWEKIIDDIKEFLKCS
jgi:hypothetical protein